VPSLKFLDILLREEPVLSPPLRLYQRLLALDQEEAAEIAHDYLKKHSLEQVYDELLLPTLAMAERDRMRGGMDEEQRQFFRQSLREMVEELADEQRDIDEKAQAKAAGEKGAEELKEIRKRTIVPKDCHISILCFPANDDADAIAAKMLAELLSIRGYCAESVSSDVLASEMVEMVESKKADLVCVSAMPPAAVTHARYLCKRLSTRFGELKTIIGLWTSQADHQAARRRLSCHGSAKVVASLAAAQDEIEQLVHPALVPRLPNPAEAVAK
jgi:hypothetical protein